MHKPTSPEGREGLLLTSAVKFSAAHQCKLLLCDAIIHTALNLRTCLFSKIRRSLRQTGQQMRTLWSTSLHRITDYCNGTHNYFPMLSKPVSLHDIDRSAAFGRCLFLDCLRQLRAKTCLPRSVEEKRGRHQSADALVWPSVHCHRIKSFTLDCSPSLSTCHISFIGAGLISFSSKCWNCHSFMK